MMAARQEIYILNKHAQDAKIIIGPEPVREDIGVGNLIRSCKTN